MGKLRIHKKGVKVEGDTEFMKRMYASHIRSTQVIKHTHSFSLICRHTIHSYIFLKQFFYLSQDSGLSIESSRNITLNARDSNNEIRNRVFIGEYNYEQYKMKQSQWRMPS